MHDHHTGSTLLSKTKSGNYPNGLAWEFTNKAKKPTPPDASTVIKLEVELDRFQLKGATDFYNDMGGIMDKCKVFKTNHELCMLM